MVYFSEFWIRLKMIEIFAIYTFNLDLFFLLICLKDFIRVDTLYNYFLINLVNVFYHCFLTSRMIISYIPFKCSSEKFLCHSRSEVVMFNDLKFVKQFYGRFNVDNLLHIIKLFLSYLYIEIF